jgi:hypothetical protein
MKVVTNTAGFGLRLNSAEMRMFCALRGWALGSRPKQISSTTTWFVGVDWVAFRADPTLVRLCEEGMLSNPALAVVEVPEDWEIDTDWDTYEKLVGVVRHVY